MLYIMRHAEAVLEDDRLTDGERCLTPRGRADALAVGAQLRARLPHTRLLIWTSPLVRAVQTAELVARAWPEANIQRDAAENMTSDTSADVTTEITVEPALALGCNFAFLVERIASVPTDTLLVGHEPSLSRLLATLTNTRHGELRRAELVAISDGAIRWRLAPP